MARDRGVTTSSARRLRARSSSPPNRWGGTCRSFSCPVRFSRHMNRLQWLVLAMCPAVCLATPPDVPPAVAAAKAHIERDLVAPLTVNEQRRSRMTRARQPALARRVRMLTTSPSKDSSGRAFFGFAVDARYGANPMSTEKPSAAERQAWATNEEQQWQKDAITGCLYPESGDVFVNRGGAWFRGALLLGKKEKRPSEGVCRAVGEQVARK